MQAAVAVEDQLYPLEGHIVAAQAAKPFVVAVLKPRKCNLGIMYATALAKLANGLPADIGSVGLASFAHICAGVNEWTTESHEPT